jgi:hypothetical protein
MLALYDKVVFPGNLSGPFRESTLQAGKSSGIPQDAVTALCIVGPVLPR